MTRTIQSQPDDSSYEEILGELVFASMVKRGLRDSLADRTIEDEAMRQRIVKWKK